MSTSLITFPQGFQAITSKQLTSLFRRTGERLEILPTILHWIFLLDVVCYFSQILATHLFELLCLLGQYLNEATWNWRLMKTIMTICHVYDKEQNYVAFDELGYQDAKPITFLKQVMPDYAWFMLSLSSPHRTGKHYSLAAQSSLFAPTNGLSYFSSVLWSFCVSNRSQVYLYWY